MFQVANLISPPRVGSSTMSFFGNARNWPQRFMSLVTTSDTSVSGGKPAPSKWNGTITIGVAVAVPFLMSMVGTSLLNLFFQSTAVDLWLASVTVLLFSGLLVFDTWRLRNVYGPDEYVGAAVQIYLDLLNMFMAILRIMGNRRN